MIPLVTVQEFAKITCNRCGQCCESMYLTLDPAEQLQYMSQEGRHFPGMTHEESVADVQMMHDMLEPTAEQPAADIVRYRCRHFKRDEEGLGVCTVYDRRPSMCSRFPYGQPQVYEGCSWNVKIIDEETL